MKALTLTLVTALTLMSAVSNAAMIQLKCGKWITDTGVRRDNTSTVFTPGRIAGNTALNSNSDSVLRTK